MAPLKIPQIDVTCVRDNNLSFVYTFNEMARRNVNVYTKFNDLVA